MAELHQNPDGQVFVRTDAGIYADSAANFTLDSGVILPALPTGADDRIYTQDKRHAIMGGGNIIDGGPMPWPLGDQIIAGIGRLIGAQASRLAAVAADKKVKDDADKAEQEKAAKARVTIEDIVAVLPADLQERLQARIAARRAR